MQMTCPAARLAPEHPFVVTKSAEHPRASETAGFKSSSALATPVVP